MVDWFKGINRPKIATSDFSTFGIDSFEAAGFVVCIGGGGLAEWTRGGHVFFSGPWTAVLQYLALISLDFTCCSSQQQDVGLLPAVSPAAPEEGYQEIKE